MTLRPPLPFRRRPCFDLGMGNIPQPSNEPRDKLHAVLGHGAPDADEDLGADYRRAVAGWFVALSPLERVSANAALAAFARGDELAAEEFARVLPPAPRFPL